MKRIFWGLLTFCAEALGLGVGVVFVWGGVIGIGSVAAVEGWGAIGHAAFGLLGVGIGIPWMLAMLYAIGCNNMEHMPNHEHHHTR